MCVSFNSFAANMWYHKWFDWGGHASTAATMLAKPWRSSISNWPGGVSWNTASDACACSYTKTACTLTLSGISRWIKELKEGISMLADTFLLHRYYLGKGEPLIIVIQNRSFWPFDHHFLGVDEALQETNHLIIQQASQMFSNCNSHILWVNLRYKTWMKIIQFTYNNHCLHSPFCCRRIRSRHRAI